MSSALINLLFKDYRRKVLALLLRHPEQKYHVREIARLTNTVEGTLHKELSKLAIRVRTQIRLILETNV